MTTRPILLDTCAVLWLGRGDELKPDAEAALRRAQDEKIQVLVSPITAWEIGVLVARGRLALTLPPSRWFETVVDSGVDLAEMSPDVLISSSFLTGPALRDPADRIIAATARNLGYRLMTRDRALLDFAAQGHIAAIPC